MDHPELFYAIIDDETQKFISRITKKSGKIYTVVNPFNSNWFLEEEHAEAWREDNNLDHDKYSIATIKVVNKKSQDAPNNPAI